MYKVGDKAYLASNLWDWGQVVKVDSRGFYVHWRYVDGGSWYTHPPALPYSKWFLDKYYLIQPLQRIL